MRDADATFASTVDPSADAPGIEPERFLGVLRLVRREDTRDRVTIAIVLVLFGCVREPAPAPRDDATADTADTGAAPIHDGDCGTFLPLGTPGVTWTMRPTDEGVDTLAWSTGEPTSAEDGSPVWVLDATAAYVQEDGRSVTATASMLWSCDAGRAWLIHEAYVAEWTDDGRSLGAESFYEPAILLWDSSEAPGSGWEAAIDVTFTYLVDGSAAEGAWESWELSISMLGDASLEVPYGVVNAAGVAVAGSAGVTTWRLADGIGLVSFADAGGSLDWREGELAAVDGR